MIFSEVVGLASVGIGATGLIGGFIANYIGGRVNKVNMTLEKMLEKQNAQDVKNQRYDDKIDQINERCKNNHKS